MQNIKTRINGLRSEDIATVGMRVIETIEQSVAEELIKSYLVTQLIEVTNRFRSAIKPYNKEEMAAINEMFNERKKRFNNFYVVISGLMLSKDATVQATATKVFSVLNMYRGIGFKDLSKSAHTQRYTTIVETLSQGEYTEAITKLDVGDYMSELADANTAYEEMFLARSNKRSNRIPSTEMRTEMNNALKAVTDEVKMFVLKYPTDANKELQNNVIRRITEMYVPVPGSSKTEESSDEVTNPDNSTEVI